jgi:hypothetical protein
MTLLSCIQVPTSARVRYGRSTGNTRSGASVESFWVPSSLLLETMARFSPACRISATACLGGRRSQASKMGMAASAARPGREAARATRANQWRRSRTAAHMLGLRVVITAGRSYRDQAVGALVQAGARLSTLVALFDLSSKTSRRMNLAWSTFTPWQALLGGLLIGVAATFFMLGNGRVAGISTLVASPWAAWRRHQPMAAESTRLIFLAGLLLAPSLWRLFAPLPASRMVTGPVGLVLAGLLVGFGTRMANGCTSGHGVCGLSQASPRSLVNVLVFMATSWQRAWSRSP